MMLNKIFIAGLLELYGLRFKSRKLKIVNISKAGKIKSMIIFLTSKIIVNSHSSVLKDFLRIICETLLLSFIERGALNVNATHNP